MTLPALRPYQHELVEESARCFARGAKGVLIQSATASGKCLGRGTPVLRYEGSIVPVEEVRPGDRLMGPDSGPRRVLSVAQGIGPLYRVIPTKGDPWVCNDVHVLTLVETMSGDVIDVGLQEWLASHKTFKHTHKLFSPETGVGFAHGAEPAELPIDPHFLGLWYGDGTKKRAANGRPLSGVEITKPDAEVLSECEAIAAQWGLRVVTRDVERCPIHSLVSSARDAGGHSRNELLNTIRVLYTDGSVLPELYLTASRQARLEFLAGMLDSDGSLRNGYFDFLQKRRAWAEGVCFVARSLGFRAFMREKVVNGESYWRVGISGEIQKIPTRLPRKQAAERRQKKIATRTGFRVEPVGEGEYFGFELDKDGRFLLGDFTVTHNTRTGLEIVLRHLAKKPTNRVVWFAHRDELIEQPLVKLRAYGAPVAALRPGERQDDSARILVASIQTVASRGAASIPQPTLVVPDEARHYGAPEWGVVLQAVCGERPRVGLDATPTGDLRALFTHIVQGPSIQFLTDNGYLVPAIHIGPAQESDTLTIDPLDDYLKYLPGERAILFAASRAAADRYAADARKRGIRAACVEGRMSAKGRRAALEAYRRGELDLLTNIFCLVEGTDLPETAGVIVARKVGAEETWVQIGGRALRPAPGKRRALILDPFGLTHRLGWMATERVWTIDGTGPKRVASLPAVVCCPNCLALGPPSAVCPGCGATTPEPPPARITKAEQLVLEQNARPRSGQRWDRFCELVRRGREKGWKPQAAPLVFRGEFGHMPPWRADMVPPLPDGAAEEQTRGEERDSA